MCLFAGEDPPSSSQEKRSSKMLIVVEMQTVVYYKNLTLEGVLQKWLQSGITAKTEHKNHNTRKFPGTKSPLLAMNTQYSTGQWKHVEILRTKHLYIVSGGSHGSTHLVCQQKSNLPALAMLLALVQALKIEMLIYSELQALVKL